MIIMIYNMLARTYFYYNTQLLSVLNPGILQGEEHPFFYISRPSQKQLLKKMSLLNKQYSLQIYYLLLLLSMNISHVELLNNNQIVFNKIH